MASKPRGTLCTGVTADLVRRTYKHREGLVEQMNPKWEDLWDEIAR